MKKVTVVATLYLAAVLSLTGCTGSTGSGSDDVNGPETAQAEKTEQSEQKTEDKALENAAESKEESRSVTFVLKNLVNPFCVTVKEGAEQAARDNNINLTVLTPVQGDNNEELMQLTEQAVASGDCDVLVVFPSDSIGIIPAVQKAYDAEIPVVILNTAIKSEEKIWETFVACKDWEIGRACGEALAERMDYKGNVILIEGVTGAQISIDRIGGAREVIESYPDMKVVASQPADMNRAKAMEVMQNLLQAHPDVNGVWAINDEMALGCVEAIAAAGKSDQIIIGGCNGDTEGRNALKEGKLAFDCDISPFNQGYQAILAAAKIIDGEEVEERIVTDMRILDMNHADEVIQ